METNLKFSDIIRYILLGSISILIISQPIYLVWQIDLFTLVKDSVEKVLTPNWSRNNTYTYIAVVVGLAASYLVGAIVQGYRLFLLQFMRRMYHYHWVRDFVENSFGNPDKFYLRQVFPKLQMMGRTLMRLLVFPSFYYDIYNYTRLLKFSRNSTLQIPEWIYISDEPQMTCEVIDKLVGKRGEDDHLYLNEFLTSLAAVTWTSLILICFLWPCVEMNPHRTLLTCSVFLLLEVVCCITAKSFGEEYIRSLAMWFRAKLEGEHRMDDYGRIIALHGAPKVYLLVRTVSSRDYFLSKTLESIERQSYKNFQVIVIEDIRKTTKDEPDDQLPDECIAQNVVERYNNREHHPSLYDRITFCKLDCGNPATTMWHERDFFLKMADKNDIAVILDDDDELRSDNALLNIVHAMTRNKANICLTSFESKGDLGLDITNNGGGVHNHLIKQFSRHSISEFDSRLCHASSIGWTKACRTDVIRKYMELLKKHRETHRQSYCDFKKYEDFPDFVMLLIKGTVITGVREATHAYYKREGRITTNPTDEDFQFCRAQNLNLLIELVMQNPDAFPDAKTALQNTLQFVLFKTCQIEDIYHKPNDADKAADHRNAPAFTFTDWLFDALSKESRQAFDIRTKEEFRRLVLDKMKNLRTPDPNNGSRIFDPTNITVEQMERLVSDKGKSEKQHGIHA